MARMPLRFASRHTVLSAAFLSSVLLGACARDRETASSDQVGGREQILTPEVWHLTGAPLLEIGIREGEAVYQLDRASGSVRLDDGRVVVLDGGSSQLRFFDAQGTFLQSVGSTGEGPGEFRNPTRLRRTLGDSLQVWDAILGRLSFFDLQGTFLGSAVFPPSTDDPMPLDEWLYDRSWIDSPLPPEARGAVRRAILAMPSADPQGPPRFLLVTRQGRIWSTPLFPPAPAASTWTVYDLEGREVATVELPGRFEPQDVGADYVLGRFRDELEINYIRLYGLEKPAGSPRGPGLDPASLAGVSPANERPEAPGPEVTDQAREVIRQAFMATATAQEIYYSGNYTYTKDLDALRAAAPRGREVPEAADVAVLMADNRGWIGTMTHRETGYMCALAYGAYLPMGWPPGSLVCP